MNGVWDKTLNPRCSVDNIALLYGVAIPNIVTDIALLVLPLPYIIGLHASIARRTALSGIFLFSGLCVHSSIFRLFVFVQQADPSIDDLVFVLYLWFV